MNTEKNSRGRRPAVETDWSKVLRAIKRHGRKLAEYPGVVVVRPGFRFQRGKPTKEPAISVCVLQKLPDKEVPPRARLPRKVDGVPVDVRVASLGDQVDAWEASGASGAI